MTQDHNPQEPQMADESMVRNLAAQAEAIWPQEREIVRRIRMPRSARILDVGCGTGEFATRILELFPEASLLGIDLLEPHLERARARCAGLGGRARFEQRDAFDLGLPPASFDLAVCRHMLQAVPEPERVVAELVRVTRPGGRVHLLAEDYGMIWFHPTRRDSDAFWREGPMAFAAATGTDLRSGRRMPAVLSRLGLVDVTLDYVVVDTLRVARETFARIWEAWRDGYTDAIAANSRLSREAVRDHWQDMIACIRDPHGYAAWLLPVVGGTVPGGDRPEP